MKFDPNASPPCFRSDAETIAKDTKVRMQLVGCRIEANDMVSDPDEGVLSELTDSLPLVQ